MAPTTPEGRAVDTSAPVVLIQGIPDALNHAVLGVARSLGRLGVKVFTIDGRRGWAGGRSRFVCGSAALDLLRASADQLLDAVGRFVGGAARALLLPVDDVAALFIEEELQDRGRGLAPTRPPGLLRELTDKRALAALLGRLDIPTAASRSASSEDEVIDAARAFGFPAVLKAGDPVALRRTAGARSVTVARSTEELLLAYRGLGPHGRAGALVQEHIGGEGATDWIFNGGFADGGRCHFHGTGVKLRQWPLGTGAATFGVCVPNPAVLGLSERLARGIGYEGVIDIDFRYDPRDGRYKLLDVNPRIGSSFRLFVSDTGLDLPRAHYMHWSGQPAGRVEARPGRKWLVEPRDLRSCLALLRSGRLGAREWLASLAGVEETAWFDAGDARPIAAMVTRYASRFAGREG
jgi:predicted ATP-grasp superfamily ATP-dependent carboligase